MCRGSVPAEGCRRPPLASRPPCRGLAPAKRDLGVMKRIALRHLLEVVGRTLSDLLWLNKNKPVRWLSARPVGRSGICVGRKLLFEDTQLAAGEGDLFDFVARVACAGRTSAATRSRPRKTQRTGQGLASGNTSMPPRRRSCPFDRPALPARSPDSPLDEVERINPVAQHESAKPLFQLGRGEGALQEADAVGDDHRGGTRGLRTLGQGMSVSSRSLSTSACGRRDSCGKTSQAGKNWGTAALALSLAKRGIQVSSS